MDLKEVLGDELFLQVDEKLKEVNGADERRDNPVRFVDLSEGSYVGKEKYTRLQTESAGYKKQLDDANKEIKSYKDMDIDGIKQAAANWETKYNTDTQALQERLDSQQKLFAAERYLDGQKIKSPLSRKSILQEFLAQEMEFKDGKFVGAEEYMKKMREQYPDEFETEEENKPIFVKGTRYTHKPPTASADEAYMAQKYSKNKYYRGR